MTTTQPVDGHCLERKFDKRNMIDRSSLTPDPRNQSRHNGQAVEHCFFLQPAISAPRCSLPKLRGDRSRDDILAACLHVPAIVCRCILLLLLLYKQASSRFGTSSFCAWRVSRRGRGRDWWIYWRSIGGCSAGLWRADALLYRLHLYYQSFLVEWESMGAKTPRGMCASRNLI